MGCCPPTVMQPPQLQWAYGVTTVPSRYITTLPSTLTSLQEAGFAQPRIYVDGDEPVPHYLIEQGKTGPITYRGEPVKTAANWILTAWELYLRNPKADRYAIFQDDFVTYHNLRQYLESIPYPHKGYLNLYTFPENEKLANGRKGFYPSNQMGRGAVALVFNREAMTALLGHKHLSQKPQHPKRPTSAVDGAIVEAMKGAGWCEHVHAPSLVQHTGFISSMGNKKHPQAKSFLGREFDAMALLADRTQEPEERPRSAQTHTAPKVPVPAVPLQAVPPATVRREELAQPKVAIVASNTELTSNAAVAIGAERWLTVDSRPNIPNLEAHSPSGGVQSIRAATRGVHTVVFFDSPFFPHLLPTCDRFGIRTVGVITEDRPLRPTAAAWAATVSDVLCPGPVSFDSAVAMGLPAVLYKWPTHTSRQPALRGHVMGQLQWPPQQPTAAPTGHA